MLFKRGLLLAAGCILQVCLDLSAQDCTITPVHTDIPCYGENTGIINVSVSGGTEPYVFAWTGPGSFGSISQDLTGLGAGSYNLTVFGAGGSCTGTAIVIINQPSQPLTIITQPLNQTDCYGNAVEFSVETAGSVGEITYQWQSSPPGGSFTDIYGENFPSLTIPEIGVNGLNIDGTEYQVLITDDCGTITSESALLSINAVTGLSGSVNLTICNGEGTSYSVSTHGSVVGYQWSFNDGIRWRAISDGSVYSGTNSQQLIISDATPAETGGYRVSVTYFTLNQPPDYSTCVITTHTRNRNLTVMPPVLPGVVTANQAFCHIGTPEPLSVAAATGGSGPPYSYQWQVSTDHESWNSISGAQSLVYSPPALTTTTWYRVAVTDAGPLGCGTAYSYPVAIIVSPLPVTSSIYHH